MYRPKKIIVKNFLSYEFQEFEFINGTTSVVSGLNKDAYTPKSNGSGKSAITVDAVFFALTGDSIRGLRIQDMVRRGQTEGSVDFFMEEVSTGKVVSIFRNISTNKSSKASIQVDENDIGIDGSTEVWNTISEKLNLSKDDLRSSFIISKENDSYKPFYSKTDGQLKEFINTMSNINEVDPAFDTIKSKAKELESKISVEDHHLSEIRGAIALLETRISKADTDTRIKDIEDDIVRMTAEVGLKSQQYEDMEPYIISLDSKIDTLDSDNKFQIELDSIEQKNIELDEVSKKQKGVEDLVNGKIDVAASAISKANAQLSGAIECPKCDHEFVLNDSIDDLKKTVLTNKAVIDKLNPMKALVLDKINATRSSIKENKIKISELEGKIRVQLNELNALRNEKVQAENSKLSLDSEIKGQERLIELKRIEIKKTPGGNSDQKDLEELMDQYNTKEKIVIDLREELQEILEYDSIFKKFKNHLTRKVIDTLNIKVNLELRQIYPGLLVQMDGFNTDSKGKVSEKIDVRVLQDGEFIGNYRSQSGGEKGSIDLASIIATNKIKLELCGSGLDFIGLDEIFERMDPEGCYRCFNYLSKQDKTISVISHAPIEKVVENIKYINVEKFNRISRIV